MAVEKRTYNAPYTGEHLNRIAFPLGGLGAGMICLEGTGAFSHVSVRGQMDVYNEPEMYAALHIAGDPGTARVLEGPVPAWKYFGSAGTGNGGPTRTYGLPRCRQAVFTTRFPFATVDLADADIPLTMGLVGWSPFTPGDADASSLPVAGLEYRFSNPTGHPVEAVFSFHAKNFMATGATGQAVRSTRNGFVLWQAGHEERPWEEGAFGVVIDDPAARVDCAWFRGGWWDARTMVWNTIASGGAPERAPITEGAPSAGGSVYVPFTLAPGAARMVTVRLAWHVPHTNIRAGKDPVPAEAQAGCDPSSGCCPDAPAEKPATHRPWYAGKFADIEAVNQYWYKQYDALRARSEAFADCFYDTTLPAEVVEAVAANLTILKSPTVQRQTDGRFWAWEGCHDSAGCCHGTCTHVWNYAQALPHLFPDMERSLRETEFSEDQDEHGHQTFRTSLPVRPNVHDFHAAADGQLGGIMKMYREWRISGDTAWLKAWWPRVRRSLDYCIETWDPDHTGALVEPHHNTYDIEFWGPDGMCTSFYLGALQAAARMGRALGDDVRTYETLLEKGRAFMETELWDGEYFIQKIVWRTLRAPNPAEAQALRTGYSPEALELLEREGPKYQYGSGCLSDGILGAWMARVCGVDAFLDPDKESSHLRAIHRYNLKKDLSTHANPQRPTYAIGAEGGLLLCSWPKGGRLSLPFVYSDEVWTGIEYQVASHLMLMGRIEEGLEIVRACRDRYDGRVRNPFNEYECGHWYARAMASYGLIQGLTGIRYDAVERILYIAPAIPGDFRSFLCTATGYGVVGIKGGQPFVEIKHGSVPYERIVYTPRG
jgi:uncharacterized protein (DUF608 family)